MDESDIARLFVPPWKLLLIHTWVLLPVPLAACAGTIGAGWTISGMTNRLIAIIAGLLVGGFMVEWGILEFGERYVDAPSMLLLYAILGLASLAGAVAAYFVSRRTTVWLGSRRPPA
jgi:hypothetical protein